MSTWGKNRGGQPEQPTRRIIHKLIGAVTAVSLLTFGGSIAFADPSPTGATIASDLADYPPGGTVTLSGAGWAAGEPVRIVTNDAVGNSWVRDVTVTATANGTVSDVFALPNYFVSNYNVTATGPTSGKATTTFTDLAIGTYDQCSNDDGDGYASGDTGCRWTNGNLQANNSTYTEGDSTPQRLWLTDLAQGSTHTLTLQYGTTKGGKHAYDYLTTFNASESWITDADKCDGVKNTSGQADCQSWGSDDTLPIPVDPNPEFSIGAKPPLTLVPQPAGRNFTMRNGDMTAASTPSVIFGSYASDSETAITITFTVGGDSDACATKSGTTTCSVVLWFGGHIAKTSEWTSGGATAVPGSPYHVALDKVDGASVGQRDNQMQANAIVQDGSLVLAKTLTGGPANYTGPFTIAYDCTGTAFDGSAQVSVGTPVTILAIPAGTVCTISEPNLPTVTGYSFGTPTFGPSNPVTIVSSVAVTVTTNNTLTRDHGNFKISKSTDNPDKATLPAAFTGTYDCGVGYTGTWSVTDGGSQTISDIPTGSTCSVAEDAPANIPGFTWATPTYSPTSIVISTKDGTFEIKVKNSITRDVGNFKISKSTVNPDGGTLPSAFTGTYDCGVGYMGSWSVANGGSQTINGIPVGSTCSVAETAPAVIPGFTWATPSYTPALIVIETKDATFEIKVGNSITRDLGKFKISKATLNPDGAVLPAAFSGTYNCGIGYTGNWSVAEGGSQTISNIPTGNTCSVVETAPAVISGFTWATPSYTPALIVISAKDATFEIKVGNSITRDRGSLTIVKKVVNDNGGTATVSAFGLTSTAGILTFDGGVLNGSTSTYTSQKITVVTGPYTLKENDVHGYTEGTWSCTNGTALPTTYNNGSVNVDKDKDVVCTITNDDQPGKIVIKKVTKPAGSLASFAFETTVAPYVGFSLADGQSNSQTLDAGTYTAKELATPGWILTGIGGSVDPNTPTACTVEGKSGSSGSGSLLTQTATITLKIGDTVTCVFENTGQGTTRTQGFWSTHSPLAEIAWFGGTAFGHTFPGVAGVSSIGDRSICGRKLATLGDVTGAFWSNISKQTTGAKRSALDQARMTLLQQLIAAELNASAFGSSPISGSFAAWESALCGTDVNAIKKAQSQAASFNEAGDSGLFTPGTSADSKNARAIANLAFWDSIS